MAIESITIDPAISQWRTLVKQQPEGALLGSPLEHWRERTRAELQLPGTRPIVTTGHQPTLWHPGILAKYLAVDISAAALDARAASVIVDQDVVEFGVLDVPEISADGSLAVRRVDFAPIDGSADTPVGCAPPFVPREVALNSLDRVPPEIREAVVRVFAALKVHSSASNAAMQVHGAVAQLMQEALGAAPFSAIAATELMATSLARALLSAMLENPMRCARAYNEAAGRVPEAGLRPLLIRDDYVELPLWRLRDDSRAWPERVRAYDADVANALDDSSCDSRVRLLPRALFMTAVIRLGVSDVFVHGRGGAIYDRVMERWIDDWLGVRVAPMAIVSADVRLPLMREEDLARSRSGSLDAARWRWRRLLHDPEVAGEMSTESPGRRKRELIDRIHAMPRNTRERRMAFLDMHQELREMRKAHEAAIQEAEFRVERESDIARNAVVAKRRDWCFALYPAHELQTLRERIKHEAAAV